MKRHALGSVATVIMLMTVATLASCIDEDMSDCGVDYQINYTVRLQTNLATEIRDELSKPEEQGIARKLEAALANVLSDKAHDLDLFFYTDNKQSHTESHVIQSNQSSFTIYMPVNDYRHLALANDMVEPTVNAEGQVSDLSLRLRQAEGDTVDSHVSALFSSRLTMHVNERDQVFNSILYMQNAVPALVIDYNDHRPERITAVLEGMATSFAVDDSVYSYTPTSLVRTNFIEDEPSQYCALYGVCFPSEDEAPTNRGTRADDDSTDAIWKIRAYVTIDGKITENTISVKTPLKAGQMEIIKLMIGNNGELISHAANVGVSVQLDWKPGGVFEPEL